MKRVAAANAAAYDSAKAQRYADVAPHIRHHGLRSLYGRLLISVYDSALRHASAPETLDLGAGEGSVSLPFLELGAKVTAVDVSEGQLRALEAKCARYADKLELRREDVFDAIRAIRREGRQYDIVVANSFLHHIPDYLGLLREAAAILSPHGQFFSFQDPMRYDSIGRFAAVFTKVAYVPWRMARGDIMGGLKRRIRRARGIYLDECSADNVEYHNVRGGVDQEAIRELFEQLDFECEIVRYFSTQTRMWQQVGTALGVRNTFATIARRSRGA